jgi:hypothetical protein
MKQFGREASNIHSEHKREGYIGPTASTGNGGKSMNVNNLNNSQLRGLLTMAPYGISSRGKAGMKAQVIVNDNSNNAAVGIYDPNKPEVEVGEIVLYSTGGCTIYLDKDGNITMTSGSAKIIMNKVTHGIAVYGDVSITGTLKVNGVSIG